MIDCHWEKKVLCNQKGTNYWFCLLQITESGYFKVHVNNMHINKEENLNVFGIFDSVILTNPQSLRWTVSYKLLENNSDTQMSFLLLLITFIWTIVNLCTLFHISVANCKWGQFAMWREEPCQWVFVSSGLANLWCTWDTTTCAIKVILIQHPWILSVHILTAKLNTILIFTKHI